MSPQICRYVFNRFETRGIHTVLLYIHVHVVEALHPDLTTCTYMFLDTDNLTDTSKRYPASFPPVEALLCSARMGGRVDYHGKSLMKEKIEIF